MDERSAEEFREFMHGRWPSMVRLAYGLTGDQGHAEDVAAAAFARAYASWPRVRRSGNPDAYVRQIVINENRNRFRKHRVPSTSPTSSPSAEPRRDRPPRRAAGADRGAAALGPRQRAVVVLRYWVGLTETEAAVTLGCSVGTVKSQASRALAALRTSTELVDGGHAVSISDEHDLRSGSTRRSRPSRRARRRWTSASGRARDPGPAAPRGRGGRWP